MPTRKKSQSEILRVAKTKLGFEALRPGQAEAVQAVLEDHDTLVVQPTGSGKSAIYQIAGLMISGSTVVISPLIALQKDQSEAIEAQNAAPVAVVNSSLPVSETKEAFAKLDEGALEYMFLSPEQLKKAEVMDRLRAAKVSLFVVDEAHCISEWGHDFRPDYLQLGSVIEALGHPVTLAMTATASPQVRQEIVERLGMRDAKIYVQGFDRPNIKLAVERFQSEGEKLEALAHRVRWAEKPGIVYVSTRKNAESIMSALREEGVEALFYHAGLKAKERTSIQDQFMGGNAEVIVATNAFGMGVDKADVRFVYHYDVPDSLDSYYQEIGRAGRDGEPSEAMLYYRPEDTRIHKFHAGSGKGTTSKLETIVGAVQEAEEPVPLNELSKQTGLSERQITNALHKLEDAGAVEVLPGGEVKANDQADVQEAVKVAAEAQQERSQAQRQRIEEMQMYADLLTCRREYLLKHFGDDFQGPCGNCDNCLKTKDSIGVDPKIGTRREVTA